MKSIIERITNYSVDLQPSVELVDIITMLIGTTNNKEVVQKLSSTGARHIASLTIMELVDFGLTKKQAIMLHTAVLFMKKFQFEKPERMKIRCPEDAAEYLMEEMSSLSQEHFVVLYLNAKNDVIHKRTISVGTLDTCLIHPREVFREALKYSAASIFLAHNHPSGNYSPSPGDIEITEQLERAGELMQIKLLDHIIIGDREFISLKEQGYI